MTNLRLAEAPPLLPTRYLVRLGEPALFFATVGGYLLLTLALRAALFGGMTADEAEQVLFAQNFALGYEARNPPLLTWLTLVAQSIVGEGLAAVLLVRFACLLAFYGFLFAAARRLLPTASLALLAALSPLALWFVGWDAWLNYSHSTLIAACCAATLWALLRLKGAPTTGGFLVLGLAVGAGFIAKHNFGLYVVALFGAALLDPTWRRVILRPGLALAFAVAGLILLSHAAWLVSHLDALETATRRSLQASSDGPTLSTVLVGSARFAGVAIGFASPLLPLFAVLLGRAARLTETDPVRASYRRLLLGTVLLYVVLLALLVLMSGAVTVRGRYFFPLAIPLPLLLFLLLDLDRLSVGAVRRYAVALGALAVIMPAALATKAELEPKWCRHCPLQIPYAKYAEAVRAAGFDGSGTIFSLSTDGADLGENLRRWFPAARLVSRKHLVYRPPAKPGPCLVLWDAMHDTATATAIRQGLLPGVGSLPPGAEARTIAAPLDRSTRPAPIGFSFLILPPAEAAVCP